MSTPTRCVEFATFLTNSVVVRRSFSDNEVMLETLRLDVANRLAPLVSLEPSTVAPLLEVPKDVLHGDLAFPTFALAKQLRKAPPLIAQDLAAQVAVSGGLQSVVPAGGYVNFTFDPVHRLRTLCGGLAAAPAGRVGWSSRFHGKKVVVEYSSPNVAKPMHVGHLRATVIGQAIKNLAQTQGYDVIGMNHLGDWGVQFGKLAWAYQNWAQEYDFSKEPFRALLQLYVRFHDEAEKNPALEKLGAETFLKLEAGDPEIRVLWQKFVDITLANNQRIYDLLNVSFELVRGESFYSDRLAAMEQQLEAKGLLEESDGAMVVRLDEKNIPPCLIRKTDGGSLYATRDIASAVHRFQDLGAELCLYIVAQDQSLHFEQVFGVLEKMAYPWATSCIHVPFGLYRFKDQTKISTRKGNVVLLEEILDRAVELTREIIAAKNPDLPDADRVAQQVGVGAVIFNDLVNDRVRNVDFDWDRVLDFNGDTGPYVQYSQVRCRSLIKKYGRPFESHPSGVLDSPAERQLIRLLLSYPDVLSKSWDIYKPSVLAQYLVDVAQAFGGFYQNNRILGEEETIQGARMSLVHCTQRILESGLRVLSMDAPESM